MQKQNFKTEHTYVYSLALGIIVLSAILIRVDGLTQKGLYLWDEGVFYEAGVYVHYRLSTVVPGLVQPDPKLFDNRVPGVPVPGFPTFLWKPFHVLLTFAAQQITGYRDYSGPCLSVFFAACTIIAVYALGARISSPNVGLLAAYLLAFSPYHLLYSRSGLQESDSMFFLVLGLTFYYSSIRETRHPGLYMLFTGVCGAVALGISYRWTLFLPFLFLSECLTGFRERKTLGSSLLRSYGACMVGFLAVVCFIDLCYRFFFPVELAHFERHTYAEAVWQKFGLESQWNLEDPFYYFAQLLRVEKSVAFAVICTGLLYLLLKGTKREKGLLPFTLLPMLFFGLVSTRLIRVAASFIPFLYLAASCVVLYCFTNCPERFRKMRIPGLIAFLIVYSIPAISTQLELTGVKSPYEEVVSHVTGLDSGKHVSTMWPLSAVYGGCDKTPKYPLNSIEELYTVYLNGYKYLVVDYQKYYFNIPDWLAAIEQSLLPIKAWNNPVTEKLYAIDENHSRRDRNHIIRTDPTIGQIKLYDLEKFFEMDTNHLAGMVHPVHSTRKLPE